MSDYVCQRCGTDWEGAPGHPKSYCDVIFNEAEVKRLNLQLSEAAEWRKSAEAVLADHVKLLNEDLKGEGRLGESLRDVVLKLLAENKQIHQECLIAWNNWGRELQETKRLNGELKEEIRNATPYLKAAQLNNPTEPKRDMIRRLEELTASDKRKSTTVCPHCGALFGCDGKTCARKEPLAGKRKGEWIVEVPPINCPGCGMTYVPMSGCPKCGWKKREVSLQKKEWFAGEEVLVPGLPMKRATVVSIDSNDWVTVRYPEGGTLRWKHWELKELT